MLVQAQMPACFVRALGVNLIGMRVTLELPDEWADCLPLKEAELAEIVAAGLRHRKSRASREIHHLADVVDTLAELPSAEEVLALRPSRSLTERINFLLDKKRTDELTPGEAAEWEDIMRVEHLMRIAKAKAAIRLRSVDDGK
jgi:hypothetical protein